jgi:glucose/arabinose dehydrogenase
MEAPEEEEKRPGGVRLRRVLVGVALVALVGVGVGYYLLRGYLAGFVPALVAGGEGQLFSVKIPEGFRITYFAEEVEGARSLTLGPDGLVFVGSRGPGNVYGLVDADGDGVAERTHVIDDGLNSPNGVAFRDGALYVAEISRILRYDDIARRLDDPPEPVVVRDDLPTEEHHGWKFIAFGPDGDLYVPIGAPCNVCESEDPRFAAIHRMSPDGSDFELVASGVRNTVGFDWHPVTGELWFTDNGRDWLGDDSPPDELNRAREPGAHYGFPYCHGKNVRDPEHTAMSCDETTAPVVELDPHGAALGMRFYTGERFPERYRGGIFIAQHGSWNRSVPVGYRVLYVGLEDDGTPKPPEVFAEGWLHGSAAWGRPVDLVFLPDGSMLLSDDKEGAVYHIDYVD